MQVFQFHFKSVVTELNELGQSDYIGKCKWKFYADDEKRTKKETRHKNEAINASGDIYPFIQVKLRSKSE